MIAPTLLIGGALLIARGASRRGTPIAIITGTLFMVLGVAVSVMQTVMN